MAHKDIPLKSPIEGHGGKIGKVVLREPTARDFFELGEPSVVARNPDGTVYAVDNDAVIRQYIERCLIEPDAILIGQLSLADAIAVKRGLLDFFEVARLALLPTSPTSSSSSSASPTPPPSQA